MILIGSDLDRGVFGSYVADGLLNVPRHTTLYLSRHDEALGMTQFLTRRERLGQIWGVKGETLHPQGRQAIKRLGDRLTFVNVSDAEGSASGNGHGYFRASHWASSDILMTIYYGLTPEQRGLVSGDELPAYRFPPDYIARLWDTIEEVDPVFARNYRALKSDGDKPTSLSQ